jgi:hypothetical protein
MRIVLALLVWMYLPYHQSTHYSLGKEDHAFLDNLPIVTGSRAEPPEKSVENP